MQEDNGKWFIVERSEALASLMLTSRADLTVRTEKKCDDGDVPTTKHFVVQVKGTMSREAKDWAEQVHHLYEMGRSMFLPVCVFVINIQSNDAAYAWVAEPEVKAGSAALHFFDRPDFHTLDEPAVDQMVNEVRVWYDSMPRSLASHS